MNNLVTLIKKELLDAVRTNKVMVLAIVMLFVAISSPALAKLMPLIFANIDMKGLVIQIPDPTYLDAIDQFIKNLSQIAVFILIFQVAGVISDEKVRKTLDIILTKPISRAEFVLAKFFSAFAIIKIVFLASAVFFYAYTVSLFGTVNFVDFAVVSLAVLLYLLVVAGITISASSMAKNTITAASIGLLFILFANPLFGLIKGFAAYSPFYILSGYREIFATHDYSVLVKPVIVSVIIIANALLLSVRSFQRMEIER
jgi:ABC-2 type transport system permease protein